jgi:hypothetical protein
MFRRLFVLLVPWLLAAAPPGPIALTADEVATLAAHKIVVRSDLPAGGTSAGAMGVLDVAAPVDRTIDAILDLEARVGEISGLKSAQVYERTPTTLGVRWELKVITTTVVFHVKYAIDRSAGWLPYTLDASKTPNDLVSIDGSYQVYAVPTGTRIVFRSSSDSGRNIPDWVKRWLAVEALTQQLDGIRRRAEAAR